jgi:hypothetical protein
MRPVGEAEPWILRLLTIAVAVPVLSMAAIGTATAALWLRYRAPVRDSAKLGALGRPSVAIPLAAMLIVLGAIGQPLLPTWLWLVSLIVLDLLALAWLRRAIHLGLLEEAAEIEIGPPFTCANCGAQTPRHTFCIDCGVSLQALPKARKPGGAPPLPDEPSAASP